MLFILLISTILDNGLAFNYTQYFQTDYIINSERFEVTRHNEVYIGNPVIKNFKYNRTHFGVNLTAVFKKDLGNDFVLDIQGYKFASNEYRLFPLTFPINVCEAITKNVFGAKNLFHCGRMFECPIRKGYFSICNWMPDYTKFPPRFPRGGYMLEIRWMYLRDEVMCTQWYMSVKDARFL